MENKTTIWIPINEAKLFKEYNDKLAEDAKKLDWGMKVLLQFKAEKGDFDDIEPIIRHRLLKLAYGE